MVPFGAASRVDTGTWGGGGGGVVEVEVEVEVGGAAATRWGIVEIGSAALARPGSTRVPVTLITPTAAITDATPMITASVFDLPFG